MRHLKLATPALALALALSACANGGPAADAPPGLRATASIQELMIAIIDPAADAVWDAVSTETGPAGTVENQPRTDEQWQAVRKHAITLIEGADLLSASRRPVAHQGRKLDDAHVEGISTVDDIRRAIDADPARFRAFAHHLHDAGKAALDAVDARDAARLQNAGAQIDQACEGCHVTYWYPNTARPPSAWPAPAAGK